MDRLTARLLKLARRIEPLGGQNFSYVKLDDVLAVVEAALAAMPQEPVASAPYGWSARSERDNFPPTYKFTRDPETAAKWQRRGESPTALFASPAQGATAPAVGKWAIDNSTPSPILTYENCSVIQDEQAFYVLGLVKAAATAPSEEDEPSQEEIDAWLLANCGTGIPHGEAVTEGAMLHGLAYVLRQIEHAPGYRPTIGQVTSATSALRMALNRFAFIALRTERAKGAA